MPNEIKNDEKPLITEFAIKINKLICNHHKAGAKRNQHIGTHTGRAVGVLPLRADDHADHHGTQQPQTDAADSKLHKIPP